ncbi:MAG: TetR/AcrR family transcriptional regulator [Clostridia bacterium]|nr:TetR/AcrR family transcriptional regulator [Clostridia bacterium]
MSKNPEKDALRAAATKQKLVETGFHAFAERTIDPVTMNDIAEAAGVAVTTVYHYFPSKPSLVTAISAWVWKQHADLFIDTLNKDSKTAAEELAFLLETFLELYRHHRDLLRFNQFFNVYVQHEGVTTQMMRPYTNVIKALNERFHVTWLKGQEDGTLRPGWQEQEVFCTVLHLMLAAVTRYAVGLTHTGGLDPEKELIMLKDMLLETFTVN